MKTEKAPLKLKLTKITLTIVHLTNIEHHFGGVKSLSQTSRNGLNFRIFMTKKREKFNCQDKSKKIHTNSLWVSCSLGAASKLQAQHSA
jgi:hypothetical protein